MKHRIKGRKLNRTSSHRAALMRSLATSVLKHKRIKTTLAKAKEARGFVEDLITKARKNDLHSKRLVMKVISDKEVTKELFNEIVPKVGDRPGGYTRVVKLGNRIGDAASMAILELVDYNDVINKKAEEKKEKKEEKRKSKAEAENNERVEEAKVVEEIPAEEENKK
jgi:large subunit ribosomal protein L17